MQFCGVANCHWTEGMGVIKRTYEGKETYLNDGSYLIGGRDGLAKINDFAQVFDIILRALSHFRRDNYSIRRAEF